MRLQTCFNSQLRNLSRWYCISFALYSCLVTFHYFLQSVEKCQHFSKCSHYILHLLHFLLLCSECIVEFKLLEFQLILAKFIGVRGSILLVVPSSNKIKKADRNTDSSSAKQMNTNGSLRNLYCVAPFYLFACAKFSHLSLTSNVLSAFIVTCTFLFAHQRLSFLYLIPIKL